MARRLEDLKLRNTDRWKAHLQERAESEQVGASTDGGGGDADSTSAPVSMPSPIAANPMPAPVPAPAPNTMNRVHFAKLHNRDYQRVDTPPKTVYWQRTRQAIVVTSPSDAATSAPPPRFSPYKYHVPVTSVTRTQGDCKLFLCCGWRWTSAQWIWALNFVCFLAHTAMIFVTLHFAYWRHGLDPGKDTKHVEIPIYRIRNIPTQYMIDNNLTSWSQGEWNLTSSDPNSGLFLEDNGRPINLASLVIAFFATSAVFHFFACVAGAFHRWWFWYWRQLDDCFAWWRWAEYSISAALMAIALGIVLGIREQNTLASLFMLTFATQTYGFLTE